MLVNIPLLAVTLPVAVTNPPVRTLPASMLPDKLALVVAIVPTMVPLILPAVMLPVPEITPDPNKILPPVILPLALTSPPVTEAATILLVYKLPKELAAVPISPTVLEPALIITALAVLI